MRFVRFVAGMVAVLAVGYGALVLGFSLREESLIFHPDPGPVDDGGAVPGLESRLAALQTGPARIVARVIPPPPTVPAAEAPWLLYFHGNGGNIGTPGYLEAWAMLRGLGAGILAVDYEGYGESGGEPSESACYRDADAAYAFLRDSLGVPPARILIYGFSLGSAVAVDLAARVPAAALMVEGALLSVPDLGADAYPFLPVRLMVRNRFASAEKIGRAAMPKLFIHSREDAEIPIAHGRRLFELAAPPKTFVEVRGGHTTAFQVDPGFRAGVADFLAGLGFPPPAGDVARGSASPAATSGGP